MATLARIPTISPISRFHTFRTQYHPVLSITRVGPGSWTSIRASTSTTEIVLDDKQLQTGIAEFYDELSGIWEDIWGEHIHHGFYDADSTVSISDHRSAQIRMVDESLRFASVSEDRSKWPKSIVDVGCGIGGSSRYLAKKFGATSVGITLSPVQAQRANALAAAQGLADKDQKL